MGLRDWLCAGADAAVVAPAPAVVVLGGHPRVRCPEAVALWRSGRAARVVTVGGALRDGLPGEVRKSRAVLRAAGLPAAALVEITAPAPGTWEEAGHIAALASAEGWERLLVVSSPYHCRRAGEMLRRRLGPGVALQMVAATEPGWDRLARDPRLLRLVGRELAKLALWRAGLRERIERRG